MDRFYVHSNPLVIDLGMNNGDDTDYYLKKGFRVVAVEANPTLAAQGRARFVDAICAGQLTLIEGAIWNAYAELPFYISSKNLHWSSLNPGWASRDNSTTEAVQVRCVPLAHLFAVHGVPRYLKIDIEGADEMVIDQLDALAYLPHFVSVEDCRFGFRYLEKLITLGYKGFKLSNQALVNEQVDEDIGHRFTADSSGPMGDDLPGPWLDGEQILAAYEAQVRTRDNQRRSPPGVWWDMHARGPEARTV